MECVSSQTIKKNGLSYFRIQPISRQSARPKFIGFAKAYPAFQKLNCELLGLSIDNTYAHIAWVRNIKQNFGVVIPFPIIEDLSMKVAHAYGMIQPAPATRPRPLDLLY